MINRKKFAILTGLTLAAACIAVGCGIKSGENTGDNSSMTEQPQETEASPSENEQDQDTAEQQVTEQPQTEPQTTAPETEQGDAEDTESYIDNPAAGSGEGDTNGFYDDEGTWITVYKNANGDWVDESGMVYVFGDDGVTDQNGVFYPY